MLCSKLIPLDRTIINHPKEIVELFPHLIELNDFDEINDGHSNADFYKVKK